MGVSSEAEPVQFRANRAHPPVHHIAGRDHVGAGLGVAGGGAGEQLERGVIENPGA